MEPSRIFQEAKMPKKTETVTSTGFVLKA